MDIIISTVKFKTDATLEAFVRERVGKHFSTISVYLSFSGPGICHFI